MSSTTAVQPVPSSKAVLPEPLTTLTPPVDVFHLDQYKNGIFVDKRSITKNRLVFGRAPDCDFQLDHPSISRYHATLLWSPKNDDDYQKGTNTDSFWYLIDCGSTHGTVCNKAKVDIGKMIKLIPNNNVFKFGASTRFFILGSPMNEEDDAYESDHGSSISLNKANSSLTPNDDACSWGIEFDCEEEEDSGETGDSIALKSIISAMKGGESVESANRNAFSENPYRCIQQWFEREGHGCHLDYRVDTVNKQFKCTFDLPIDGQWIPIEGALANRKKDAISNACVKCCSILDQAQLLFPWQKQNSKKVLRKELYDNDDSDLIDETVKKKQKKGHDTEVDNYETLNVKWKTVNDELCKLKVRLSTIGLEPGTKPENLPTEVTDSLDVYLAEMNKKKFGLTLNEKIEKSNFRMQIKQLEREQSRLEKLIQIAKPSEVKIQVNNRLPLSSTSNVTTPSSSLMLAANSDKVSSNDSTREDAKPIDRIDDETSAPIRHNDISNDVSRGGEPPLAEEGQMKAPTAKSKTASSSSAKLIRKMRQDSIIDAIEKEKKLEKKRLQGPVPENETDYVGWLPPVNQSGDGKTHLNDKFGY